MNPLLCNITIASLTAFHYSLSPIFSGLRTNLYFKDFNIDRSFSTFLYNIRYTELKKSKFSNFLDTVIYVDNDINISGFFQNKLDLNGMGGIIKIIDSIFYKLKGPAIIQNIDEFTSIFLIDSQFVDISGSDDLIYLQQGSSLYVNSSCFYNLQEINSLLKIRIYLPNTVQLNYTTIYSTISKDSLLDCANCSFDVHNVNFTSNEQKSGHLMVFSSMNYFSVIYLNLVSSIKNRGFYFKDHIDLANFTLINVNNNNGNGDSYIFYVEKGSIYVYYSVFNIENSNLIYVFSSTAFFYQCNSSVAFNCFTYDRMIWSFSCREKVSGNEYLPPADPNFFVPLLYCKDGSYPNLSEIQPIPNLPMEKSENLQSKGATEILGIILLSILSLCIVGITLWLILYFVAFKNPLREFNDDDDQMAKWKQRWNWIIANSNKAVIEHEECSDMEIDPIELSEDAVKRRHLEFYDVGIPEMVSEGFGEITMKKTKSTKRNKIDDEDELSLNKSDEIVDDIYMKSESHKSKKDDVFEDDDSHKKATTVKFQSDFFNDPKNNKTQTTIDEDEKKKKNKNEIKRTKSLKIHFKSSDEDEESKDNDDDDKSEIISESDDMDADNDKIINDLEKTKNTWTRFQKTGIDKTLGTIDESSDSSWGFKYKNFNFTQPKPPEDIIDSENIWSDDSDNKKKKKKDKKDDSEYDSNYDNDIWSDDDDDDDEGGDDEGDDDDDIGDLD